ncbi:MAG: outer membrane protein assembly factor BamC [Pseudomonadota bacterium]
MTRFAQPAAIARRFTLLGIVLALSACSVLDSEKINYKSATRAPTLEIPPDLSQLTRDTRYVVPGAGPVSASSFQTAQVAAPTGSDTATAKVGDVRIERDGSTRWLVVDRPADKLWDPTRDFWAENGFLLTIDQANLGIMETDWAENRAKIPQDFIRNTIGKFFDSAYSTSERDKFRTRMERNANGGTDIYISHRGMQEVYAEKTQKDQTVWQARPSDPELEAEFLRRLMMKLGGLTVAQAREAAAGIPATAGVVRSTSRVATVGGAPVVQIDEGFDRAWRRVGLSLDRTGFTVEDRDRSQGTYFVRYVAPNADRKEQGFLGRFFNRTPDAQTPVRYRIAVRSEGEKTTVAVLGEGGSAVTPIDATRIVQVIADDLK